MNWIKTHRELILLILLSATFSSGTTWIALDEVQTSCRPNCNEIIPIAAESSKAIFVIAGVLFMASGWASLFDKPNF